MRTSEEKDNLKYMNRAQQECLLVSANTTCVVASRRFGKSFLVASHIIRNVQAMPGGTGGYVASSYRQAHERTLPSAIAALQELGFVKDLHFVVGKRPPQRLGYGSPHVPPEDWSNVVSFYNGSIMIVLSQDVPLSANSLTLDWVVCDEAKGLKFDKLKDEVFAANGGTMRFFSDCPWHHATSIFSDMPVGKEGSWILNYREKMDTRVIDAILQLAAERYSLVRRERTEYVARHLRELEDSLSFLRRRAVYYREWSIFENIDLVGVDYVRRMKRDLPPLVFWTSILCRRMSTLIGGFYPNFSEGIHCYVANNNRPLELDGLLPESRTDYGCLLDADLDMDAPIAVAFDFNANINWLVAGQVDGSRLKVLKSFYVKYNRKVRELVDDFCAYYRHHRGKRAVFYYDTTAIGSNYAVSEDDFASVVVEQFNRNGWGVERMFIGQQMKHHQKFLLINDGLTGKKHLLPMFNKENNEALIMAIELADVEEGYRGFHKVKGGEKLKETEENPLELRTDGTDAFDTLYIGCSLFPYSSSGYMGSAL